LLPLLIERPPDLLPGQGHLHQVVAEGLDGKEFPQVTSPCSISARIPPGFMKAKSVRIAARWASAIRLPSSDSPLSFCARRMVFAAVPTTLLTKGAVFSS